MKVGKSNRPAGGPAQPGKPSGWARPVTGPGQAGQHAARKDGTDIFQFR